MKTLIRFTGDDDPHALALEIKKIGSKESTPLDLDLVQTIQFAFKKDDGNVVVYNCTKDVDSKSGIVYVPFVIIDTLVPSVKGLDCDVSVTWVANGKKRTIGKGLLILNEDVNKT